jgi:hypothetical protein
MNALVDRKRIAYLKDGRRIVLAQNIFEFLDWAKTKFEISICSLGDKNYVDMVVDILDPDKTRIRGIVYSARGEYNYLLQQESTSQKEILRMPPKNYNMLFPFCNGSSLLEPIIVDDSVHMV